jgi:hypothetical protein
VQLIVYIPVTIVVGPMERAMMQRFMEMAGNMPPEIRDAFERYNSQTPTAAVMIAGRVFMLFFWLSVGAVFSTLGGLLGAVVFRKDTPPGTIDVTPAPPTA